MFCYSFFIFKVNKLTMGHCLGYEKEYHIFLICDNKISNQIFTDVRKSRILNFQSNIH